MLDFSLPIEFNRRALISDLKRRLERALTPFHHALDDFLAKLFRDLLPADWRNRWHAFVTEQAAQGFTIAEESASQMETWIEAWARECGLWEVEPQATKGWEGVATSLDSNDKRRGNGTDGCNLDAV